MPKIFKKIRKKHRLFCSAVVMAAGASSRMGEDKLWLDLGGMPVLARTLLALERSDSIDEIVVVTREEKIVGTAELCRDFGIKKATKILLGGETRVESALAGLSEISEKSRLVAIHDGARPLVTSEVIEQAVHMAALYSAAAPAVKPKDTVKLAPGGRGAKTADRENVFLVQTPQVFVPELIKAALTSAFQSGAAITDECSAVELMGFEIRLTQGDERNIKLTTPLDVTLAETILRLDELEAQ